MLFTVQAAAYANPSSQNPAAVATISAQKSTEATVAPTGEVFGTATAGEASSMTAVGDVSATINTGELSGVAPATSETTQTFVPYFDILPPILPTPPTTSIPEQALETAKRYNIPPKLFFALIRQESGWDHTAVSRVGAVGLTQIMPFNLEAWGYDIEAFKNSPADQLEVGAKYLSKQYEKFGSWDLALAAYNAGPGAVRRYGGIPPYPETQNYVKRILGMSQNHFSWL